MGSDNLRAVDLDGLRRMRPDALAEAIAPTSRPASALAVVATAGTTLTGAVDDLDASPMSVKRRGVAPCRRRLWPSGGRRFAPEVFAGFSRADSCSVDAHKWLYLPKACGVVMSRHEDVFAAAFSHEQGYLPHQQHELHAADITLEYSRPFRALKCGSPSGHTERASSAKRSIATSTEADLLYRRAQTSEDFEVMDAPPQLSIVPFRHVPPGSPTSMPTTSDSRTPSRPMAAATSSSALIDGQVWLRPCFVNFRTTEDDVLALLDVARELGERLARTGSAA